MRICWLKVRSPKLFLQKYPIYRNSIISRFPMFFTDIFVSTLRIIAPSYRGSSLAGFWDLQTTSGGLEIPWFLGKTKPSPSRNHLEAMLFFFVKPWVFWVGFHPGYIWNRWRYPSPNIVNPCSTASINTRRRGMCWIKVVVDGMKWGCEKNHKIPKVWPQNLDDDFIGYVWVIFFP